MARWALEEEGTGAFTGWRVESARPKQRQKQKEEREKKKAAEKRAAQDAEDPTKQLERDRLRAQTRMREEWLGEERRLAVQNPDAKGKGK